jgi:alpha-tubulin suppressor-like RCC1 family protein
MRHHARWAVVVTTFLIAACTDVRPPSAPPAVRPNSDILDGAHGGGNAHFYFLPPMVQAPVTTGVFDGTQSPTVQICALSNGSCASTIASYTMTTGPGSETVRVDAADELYIVNWDTGQFTLSTSTIYRIRTLVGTQELGHVDVVLVSTGGQLKNVATGEYIGLVDGRTLPIKFRIEQGAILPQTVTFTSISVGWLTTCGLTASGTAYCWGGNQYGQVGDGTTTDRYVPTPVGGGLTFVELKTGGIHTCGRTSSGAVYCWGANDYGEIGDGTSNAQVLPTLVTGGVSFAQISVAYTGTCGLTSAGAAYCWGRNDLGQLGDGTTTSRSVPTPVATNLVFADLTTQEWYTCARTSSGDGYCWGRNDLGMLGDGTFTNRLTPTPVTGGLQFVELVTGGYTACGRTADGLSYCWGNNDHGEVGDGTTTDRGSPVVVQTNVTFAQLAGGAQYTCALTTTGAAYCWGRNEFAQLGDGTNGITTDEYFPTPVAGGLTFVELKAQGYDGCGRTSARTVYCWGLNRYGEDGNGTTVMNDSPVPVQLPTLP